MTLFIAGLILFFGPHLYSSFRSREPSRDIKERLGEGLYKGVYALISLAGLALLIKGYVDMRPAQILYAAPAWGQHVNMLLMVFALIALTASQLPAGQIKKRLKHPMLLSVKIWAAGHLLANGELNSVLLFGSFLAYAVISRIRAKRRGDIGAGGAVANPMWDIAAVFAGLGAYAALLVFHGSLFGVPVLP